MRHLLFALSLFSSSLFAASPLAVNPDFSIKRTQPWLIMVTQAGCHFCERLENQVLQPLRASDAYTGQIQFAHIGIDQGLSVTDFNGLRIAGRDFAARYAAFGTPTLLFLSPDGESLADPKYGVPDAIDFYSYQIESVLQTIAPPQ